MRSMMRYGVFACLMAIPAAGCQSAMPPALALDPNPPPNFSWLACPGGNPTGIVRGVIGRAGGMLEHPSGHVLVVPADAVASNRTFTLHEPASSHVAVIATVSGSEAFRVPVSLTINYDRCSDEVDPARLGMFRVNTGNEHDALEGEPVAPRAFRASQLLRLSAYALATNRAQ